MTPRRAVIGPVLAVLAVLALSGRAAAEAAALEPYQMVRSLQLVQDAIAFPGLSINGFTNSSNAGIVIKDCND